MKPSSLHEPGPWYKQVLGAAAFVVIYKSFCLFMNQITTVFSLSEVVTEWVWDVLLCCISSMFNGLALSSERLGEDSPFIFTALLLMSLFVTEFQDCCLY